MSKNYTKTENNAIQYEHSGNLAVEFFGKAGSLRTNNKRDSNTALGLFKPIWQSGNYELAMRLLFWVRDPRGGAGNRSGFREILTWLSNESPEWVKANLEYFPEHGRWDDMRSTFGTDVEAAAAEVWAKKITVKDFLASKWANRKDKPILRALRKLKTVRDISEFRKLLAAGRMTVVERALCSKNWNEIDYQKLPSKAMSLYTNVFQKHDAERFDAYKAALVSTDPKKKVKINASVLFPHDCVRTAEHGQEEIANAQFEALPNYMGDTNLRILPVVDSSGSMMSWGWGSTQKHDVKPIDISRALGLYCSDRLGIGNPFYRKYMQFSSENKLTDWAEIKFSDAVRNNHLFDHSIGSTNIELALDTILGFAKMFNATDEQIPNCLLIISDMQFDGGGSSTRAPVVETALDRWKEAGYSRPKVVYWNVAGMEGSPGRADSKDIGLVSGYSPSVLSSILGGKDFTPLAIMEKAIEKYKVNVPE